MDQFFVPPESTDEVDGEQQKLFEKNMRAFEEYLPPYHQLLQTVHERGSVSRVTGNRKDGNLNIDLGHVLFYEGDAESYAEAQLDKYLESPVRFKMADITDPAKQELMTEQMIAQSFKRSGVRYGKLPKEPDAGGGYLIVFGIGLGFHIDRLIDELDFRTLVLLEQYDEFLYHSLFFQDWTRWFEELHARKGELIVLLGNEPDTVANLLYSTLRKQQFGLLDGSYLLKHYTSFFVERTDDLFREKTPVLGASPGFYEDERTMFTNCFTNLNQHESLLFTDRPRLVKECPVFVVGSGPSADEAMDVIKASADKVVIISCGTALEVLLRNGVRPDFHAELENTPGPRDILRSIAKNHDLSGVTLFASTTVHPDVPELFDRCIFFFRDTTCSTQFFADNDEEVVLATTTVTNTGCRLALGLGFREIYMFGTDLGARQQDRHHSQKSIYFTDKTFLKDHPEHLAQTKFPLRVPGNLGGEVWTNHSFLLSRTFFTMLLPAYPDSKVYNCSDGAFIPGSIAKLPGKVEINSTPENKEAVLERSILELKTLERGIRTEADEIDDLRTQSEEWYGCLRKAIEDFRTDVTDIYGLYDTIVSLIPTRDDHKIFRALYQMNIGSIMIGFQFLWQTLRRVPEDERAAFKDVVCEEYRDMVGEIEKNATAFMTDLIDAA